MLDKIRCKFRLNRVESSHYRTSSPDSGGKWVEHSILDHRLIFSAVTGGEHASDENKTFWRYTPGGELKVSCASGQIADAMAKMIGQEFYIDIVPAQQPAAEEPQAQAGQQN